MSDFKSLLTRAALMHELCVDDPLAEAWWRGYQRGLRRAHYGQYGSESEHEALLAAVGSRDRQRDALGLGYRAGLTLEWAEPAADGLLVRWQP